MSTIQSFGRGVQGVALLHIVNSMGQRYNEEVIAHPDIRITLGSPLESLRNLGNIDLETLQRIVFGDAPVTNTIATALGVYFVVRHLGIDGMYSGPSSLSPNTYFNHLVGGRNSRDSLLQQSIFFVTGLAAGNGVMSAIAKATDVASSVITNVATEALRMSTGLRNEISRILDHASAVWNLVNLAPAPAIRPEDIRRD